MTRARTRAGRALWKGASVFRATFFAHYSKSNTRPRQRSWAELVPTSPPLTPQVAANGRFHPLQGPR
jgi:hypothetical protein